MSVWDDIDDTELGNRLRGRRGARCDVQTQIMRRFIVMCEVGGEAALPNLAKMARDFGVSRQIVSSAVAALRRKGAIEIANREKPVVTHRKERVLRIRLEPDGQRALPFPPMESCRLCGQPNQPAEHATA
jgi:DNA-binding FadR family transcriptional regulator